MRWGVVVVLALAASPARADRKEEANRLNREGAALFKESRYAEALARFEEAYALVSDARILYNVGLARDKLLDDVGCVEAFEKYRAWSGETGARAADAQERADACRRRHEAANARPPRSRACFWGQDDASCHTWVVTETNAGWALSEDGFHAAARVGALRPLGDFAVGGLLGLEYVSDPDATGATILARGRAFVGAGWIADASLGPFLSGDGSGGTAELAFGYGDWIAATARVFVRSAGRHRRSPRRDRARRADQCLAEGVTPGADALGALGR